MKYLLTILALLALSTVTLQAQDQPTKTKKIVIEKVIEENGETTVERIELEGEEAEAYLNNNGGEDGEMEIDVKVEDVDGSTKVWVTKNGEEMEIEIPEGEDHILMEDGDGEMHIFKIDGDGEEGEKEIRVKMKMMGEEGEKKMKKKIIIMKSEDHDEDELHEGHGEYDWKGDFDLDDLNEDDIETIDIRKENGVNEITIKMKNGDVIKKKLSGQDSGTGMFFMHDNPEENFMRGSGHRAPCDESKPFLGISMMNFHGDSNDKSESKGVKINSVTLNSGADKAGILAGDIIVQIDDQKILNFDDVSEIVQNSKVGDEIQVSVLRNDQALTLGATIGNKRCAERGQKAERWKMRQPRMKRNPCKPLIGFMHSNNEGERGVTIGEIIDGYPAARQNLQEGDLVVSFDKTEIDNWEQLIQLRDKHEAGDRFKMIVQRGNKKIKVKANFNECPKDEELTEAPELELTEDIISEESSVTEFNAFPNPSQGQLTVEYRGTASPINIQVSDISGKILINRTIDDFDGYYTQQFDFSDAPEGTLLVRLQQGDEVRVEKVILQKMN